MKDFIHLNLNKFKTDRMFEDDVTLTWHIFCQHLAFTFIHLKNHISEYYKNRQILNLVVKVKEMNFC